MDKVPEFKGVIDEVGPTGGEYVFARGVFQSFKPDGTPLTNGK